MILPITSICFGCVPPPPVFVRIICHLRVWTTSGSRTRLCIRPIDQCEKTPRKKVKRNAQARNRAEWNRQHWESWIQSSTIESQTQWPKIECITAFIWLSIANIRTLFTFKFNPKSINNNYWQGKQFVHPKRKAKKCRIARNEARSVGSWQTPQSHIHSHTHTPVSI